MWRCLKWRQADPLLLPIVVLRDLLGLVVMERLDAGLGEPCGLHRTRGSWVARTLQPGLRPTAPQGLSLSWQVAGN